jgi:hypothetical protein
MHDTWQEAMRGIAPAYRQISDRGRRLVQDAEGCVLVDDVTGAVNFVDTQLEAFLQAVAPQDVGLADRVRAQLGMGVALFPDGSGIPWFHLTDPTITEGSVAFSDRKIQGRLDR